jgi:hypothetical protein
MIFTLQVVVVLRLHCCAYDVSISALSRTVLDIVTRTLHIYSSLLASDHRCQGAVDLHPNPIFALKIAFRAVVLDLLAGFAI